MYISNKRKRDFPGGPGVKNLPSNAGMLVQSLLGELRSHMQQGNQRSPWAATIEPERSQSQYSTTRGVCCAATREGPCATQLFFLNFKKQGKENYFYKGRDDTILTVNGINLNKLLPCRPSFHALPFPWNARFWRQLSGKASPPH